MIELGRSAILGDENIISYNSKAFSSRSCLLHALTSEDSVTLIYDITILEVFIRWYNK